MSVAESPAYKQFCSSCHMPDGQGVAKLFPPLAGSQWLQLSDDTLIKMQLHGINGPMIVNGEPYRNVMPANAATMSDAQVAEALTYVVKKWGADPGREITGDAVAATRAKYAGRKEMWNVETLGELPPEQIEYLALKQSNPDAAAKVAQPEGGGMIFVVVGVIALVLIGIAVGTLAGRKRE